MTTTINLARSPFLSAALDYIASHPGCCKRDVILGLSGGVRIPNKTYAGQNANLGRLISAGLVENRGAGNTYELFAKNHES